MRFFRFIAVLIVFSAGLVRAELPIPIELPKNDVAVDFEKEILPLFRQNCLACHRTGEAEGGLVLESVDTITKGGDTGTSVDLTNVAASLLVTRASGAEEPLMPPEDNDVGAKPLTPQQLGLLQAWIAQGAKSSPRLIKKNTTENAIKWYPIPQSVRHITAIDVSPDNQFVAIARANRVDLIEYRTQRLIGSLVDTRLQSTPLSLGPVADPDMINSLSFSPDAKRLVTGGYRAARVWKRTSESASKEVPPPVAKPDFSELPKQPIAGIKDALAITAIPIDADRFAISTKSSSVVVVSKKENRQLFKLPDTGVVNELVVSSDGERLVTARRDHKAQLWDLKNRKLLQTFQGTPEQYRIQQQLAEDISLIAKKISTLAASKTILDQALKDESNAKKEIEQELKAAKNSLAEANEKAQEAQKSAERFIGPPSKTDMQSFQSLLEGKRLAEADHKKQNQRFAAAKRAVNRAQTAIPKHLTLIEQVKKQQASLVKNQKQMQDEILSSSNSALAVGIDAKGERVATAWSNGDIVVYDASSAQPLQHFREADLLEDGKLLFENQLLHWLSTNDQHRPYSLSVSWQLERTIGHENDSSLFDDRVLAVDFHRDADTVAVGSGTPSRSGSVTLVSAGTGKVIKAFPDLHEDTVARVAFSQDGSMLATASTDGSIALIDVETCALVRRLEGHTSYVLDVAWHPTGDQLISAGADKMSRVWDVSSGETKRKIAAPSDEVNSVMFVSDGFEAIASCGTGQTILLDTRNGKFLRYFNVPDGHVSTATLTPDGKHVIAGGRSGRARVWTFADAKVVADWK